MVGVVAGIETVHRLKAKQKKKEGHRLQIQWISWIASTNMDCGNPKHNKRPTFVFVLFLFVFSFTTKAGNSRLSDDTNAQGTLQAF